MDPCDFVNIEMRTAFNELLHEQKLSVVKLFRLVVNNDDSAVNVMKQIFTDNSLPKDILLGFECYRTHDWSEYCDCWFELEYLDFINGEAIDGLMLERVLENLVNGSCVHAKPTGSCVEEDYYTGLSLMHVAAGAGNKTVLKYLLKNDLRLINLRSGSCKLYPPHLAIIKSRTKMLKLMLQLNLQYTFIPYGIRHENVTLAKRLKSTRKVCVTELTHGHDVLKCFMIIYKDMRTDLIDAILKLGKPDNGAADVIAYLIHRNDTSRALHFISAGQLAHKYLPFWHVDASETVILTSIIYDNVSILRTLIKRNRVPHLDCLGYNALDIAIAFGSTNCERILNSFMSPTDSLLEEISPYILVCHLAKKEPLMQSEEIVSLFKKCKGQGHDVNHQDRYKMTPLHIELESRTKQHNHVFLINTLLSLGADIDRKDCNGRTPLHVLLTPYDSPFGASKRNGDIYNNGELTRLMFKHLLFYNPSTKLTPSAIHFAIEYDRYNIAFDYVERATRITYLKWKYVNNDVDVNVGLTSAERVLAASYVAILYELGFRMDIYDRALLAKHGSASRFGMFQINAMHVLNEYIKSKESTPMTLKACCRLVIRKTHPGNSLHTFLDEVRLPRVLKEYILCSQLLKHVQLKTFDRFTGEEITVCFDKSAMSAVSYQNEAQLLQLID